MMLKEKVYTYLGENGIIYSPIYLDGVYHTTRLHLIADEGKVLTKDGKNFFEEVTIKEDEISEWKEVKAKSNL